MNERLIEMAKAAGGEQATKGLFYMGIHNLSSFAQLIREEEQQSRWLPIKSIPSEQPVFLWQKGAAITVACYDKADNVFYDPDIQCDIDSGWTHWQPISEPPKEQS